MRTHLWKITFRDGQEWYAAGTAVQLGEIVKSAIDARESIRPDYTSMTTSQGEERGDYRYEVQKVESVGWMYDVTRAVFGWR